MDDMQTPAMDGADQPTEAPATEAPTEGGEAPAEESQTPAEGGEEAAA